jgi:hypothetical protein
MIFIYKKAGNASGWCAVERFSRRIEPRHSTGGKVPVLLHKIKDAAFACL